MSAICLKNKNTVKTEAIHKTWSSIFSSLGTEAKSCLFMKQLTATCISTILHLRKIFPDSYFKPLSFEGMTLNLLKPGNKCVDKIENWLEGAFEAIDQKYLKHLMLDIKDAESNLTLEIYTMTFNYQKGKGKSNFKLSSNDLKENVGELTISNTKIKTIRLLQMCQAVTQCYSDLPAQITLDIRLSYYEDTPLEYEPTGYKAWEPKSPLFLSAARSIEIGRMENQNQQIQAYNNFGKKNNETSEVTSEEQPKAKRELFFDTSKVIKTYPVIHKKNPGFSQPVEKNSNVDIKCDISITNNSQKSEILNDFKKLTPSQETIPSTNETFSNLDTDTNIDLIRCPCFSTEKSDSMFRCSGCLYSSHAECFGVLRFDSTKKIRFYCQLCHQSEEKNKCHDKVMISLKNSSDQQKVAVLRKILKYCHQPNIDRITLKKMEKIAGPECSKKVVEIVKNKMIEIGVVIPQGKKKNYLLDKIQLNKELQLYFYQLQYLNKTKTKIT